MKTKFLLLSASILLASGISHAQLYPQRGITKGIQLSQTEQKPVSRVAAADELVFSDDFENYVVTSVALPADWTVIDESESPYAGWGLTGDRKYSGNYSFVSGYDMAEPRDAWAISPAVTLEGGKTYYFSIWNFAPGYNGRNDEWQLTIGKNTTAKAQSTVIIDVTGSKAQSIMEWTNFLGEFTPEKTDTYYIGIHHCSRRPDCNQVMWDLLEVDDEPIKLLPDGEMYSKGGLWSYYQFITDGETGEKLPPRVYTHSDEVFTYGYHAKYCDSVEWVLDEYAVVSDTKANNPTVKYELPAGESVVETGNLLIMKNADGEAYSARERFFIYRVHERDNFSDWVGNFKPEDQMWAYPSNVSNTNDALTGISEKYSKVAELYKRPYYARTAIQGAIIPFTLYQMTPMNINKSITLRLRLPDENGLPGEEVYSKAFSMKETLGATAITDRVGSANVTFDEPVDITGSFFVELEFPQIAPTSENSLFLVNCGVRQHSDFSTYYYARAKGDVKEGWYSSVDMFGYNISTGIFPLTLFYNIAGVESITADTGHIYADGKNVCVINGDEGSTIYVSDIAGRLMHTAQVTGPKTIVSTNLNAGVYIVTVGGKSGKVVIR